jgi:hypothetical protein
MQPPSDKKLFESELATYWFDNDGILFSLSKNPKRTIENMTANTALVKQISGGRRVPLLIYLSNSPVPDKKAREFAAQLLPTVYTAMAMVSSTGLANVIMNILFRLKKPPIPIRSFTSDKEAKQWLLKYL